MLNHNINNYVSNKYDIILRRYMRNIISFISFICIISYIVYLNIFPQMNINWINIFLFLFSIFAMSFGFNDVNRNGVRINNIFIISYFFFLAVNNLNISQLQKTKELTDVYYLIMGPLLFFFITRFFDKIKIKSFFVGKNQISVETLTSMLIIVLILIKLLVFSITGIRLIDANWSGGGSAYSVGGLSGLSEIIMWLLLLIYPRVAKIKKFIIAVLAFLFNAVFMLSRNNAMVIGSYLILTYALSKRKRILIDKNSIYKVLAILVAMVILFVVFGNYRQMMRGWLSFVISQVLKSEFDNSFLNWLYGYTAINFDVFLQCMVNAEHKMTIYSVGSPYIRFFAGHSALEAYHDEVFHIPGLNGFNASTLFGPMIYEMGELYIIQALLLGIQVGALGYIARLQKSEGCYAYLMSFAALAVFGNFFSIPVFFYTSIISIIIYMFLPLSSPKI